MSLAVKPRASLESQHFHVVVIGGGINGVAVARECARAGKRTLLVEQNDFASGVTSRSTRRCLGTQRDRYANAAEIQQYTGIAPVTEASGQQHWVHWRWSCPKFLRQTFHEWAGQSILYCDWAEAYNRAQRDDKNKSHHAAVRSLAYKWMRIAFRGRQDRGQYDDSQYEAALARRRQTAPEPKPSSPFELPIRWTSCVSFQKIALKNS